LRNDGILYLQAAIPRKIVDSPAFLEHGSAEKIAVCGNTTRDPNKEAFLYEAAQNLDLKISKSNKKNKKHIAVDVLFKAYPMIPLSG
jgi:hypothetical protein